jgi:hypothetical protein
MKENVFDARDSKEAEDVEALSTLKGQMEAQQGIKADRKATMDAAQAALDEAEEGSDTTDLQSALDSATSAFNEADENTGAVEQ